MILHRIKHMEMYSNVSENLMLSFELRPKHVYYLND